MTQSCQHTHIVDDDGDDDDDEYNKDPCPKQMFNGSVKLDTPVDMRGGKKFKYKRPLKQKKVQHF